MRRDRLFVLLLTAGAISLYVIGIIKGDINYIILGNTYLILATLLVFHCD